MFSFKIMSIMAENNQQFYNYFRFQNMILWSTHHLCRVSHPFEKALDIKCPLSLSFISLLLKVIKLIAF